MRTKKLLSILSASLLITASAQAQFSHTTNAGSGIPASGSGGGMFPDGTPGGQMGSLPAAPGTATLNVPTDVSLVTSVVILGLGHSWGGDLQVTLTDPNMVEHNLFLRPGYNNPSGNFFGTPGDFTTGDFTMVSSGGASLPTLATGADIAPGAYNQTFSTGGFTWMSGDLGIVNTPLGGMSAPAGDWTLKIYDWGFGDSGSFAGFTLNGFEPGSVNPGSAYCFGDGTGTACPCSQSGNTGEGCANSGGAGGALLVGSGNPSLAADTFQLDITGVPGNKPGILLRTANQVNGGLGNPVGDGLICGGGSSLRSQVQTTSAGATTYTDFNGALFGAVSIGVGVPTNYQFWYRDTANACGGGFNFTNAWTTTWTP
jgi:hypothetical protein